MKKQKQQAKDSEKEIGKKKGPAEDAAPPKPKDKKTVQKRPVTPQKKQQSSPQKKMKRSAPTDHTDIVFDLEDEIRWANIAGDIAEGMKAFKGLAENNKKKIKEKCSTKKKQYLFEDRMARKVKNMTREANKFGETAHASAELIGKRIALRMAQCEYAKTLDPAAKAPAAKKPKKKSTPPAKKRGKESSACEEAEEKGQEEDGGEEEAEEKEKKQPKEKKQKKPEGEEAPATATESKAPKEKKPRVQEKKKRPASSISEGAKATEQQQAEPPKKRQAALGKDGQPSAATTTSGADQQQPQQSEKVDGQKNA
jgi:hypothetical protein